MRLIKLAFGLALLLLLARLVDWRASLAILITASPIYVFLACCAAAASIVVSSWRWQAILRGNGLRPPFGLLVRCYWMGRSFSHFLPGAVGGDVVRIAWMRPFGRTADVAASLVVERLAGFAALLLLAAVALFIRPALFGLSGLESMLAPAIAGLLAIVVLLASDRPKRALAGLGQYLRPLPGAARLHRAGESFACSLRSHLRDPGPLLAALLISFLFYAVYTLFHWLIVNAVHGSVPPLEIALLVPLLALLSHLPLVPNGLGITEGAFVLLFTQAGLSPEAALAAAILRRLAMVAASLPGCVLWLCERPRRVTALPGRATGSDDASRAGRQTDMCGIAGIVGGRHADHGLIERMLQLLRHRGPDDQGIRTARGATLGHRRLSIIDLDGGRQPIGNEDGTKWIVCNGEIYNYRELMRELEAKGHRFRTRSDTEVVLHLYEELGEVCLERLRGMFAFAIWDEAEQRLFAARDHLGQKPFFYRQAGDELVFASEIKAILGGLGATPRPDLRAFRQYLTLRFTTPPLTMFADVCKLPPAHFLTYSVRGGLAIRRYWDLSYEPKLRGTEEELLAALEAELVETVRLHTVSDVPLGAFLSGGLDSTLVTALVMKHATSAPIPTFSLGLPYGDHNEAPQARLVAERYGTRHHELVTVPSLLEHLPALIHHLDEPTDPLSVCLLLISRLASRHVKVVLGGNGGNELFGGYDRYYGNLYADYYALLPEMLRRGLVGPLVRLVPDGAWYKSGGHQMKWLHRASFLTGGERYAEMYGYPYFLPGLQAAITGPELARAMSDFDPYAPIREAYERAPAEHPIDRMLYADSQIRLPDHSCMNLDRTSMAHGLEARSPLMDHKLATFVARLPTNLKLRWRTMRYAQRKLCTQYLPGPLLGREKQAFSSGLPYLLGEQYRHLSDRLLHHAWLARDGILLQGGIDGLLAQQAAGGADHGHRLWLLLHAEAWYRQRICGQSPEALAALIADRATAGSAMRAA